MIEDLICMKCGEPLNYCKCDVIELQKEKEDD